VRGEEGEGEEGRGADHGAAGGGAWLRRTTEELGRPAMARLRGARPWRRRRGLAAARCGPAAAEAGPRGPDALGAAVGWLRLDLSRWKPDLTAQICLGLGFRESKDRRQNLGQNLRGWLQLCHGVNPNWGVEGWCSLNRVGGCPVDENTPESPLACPAKRF
jgi:hypothetical protein